MKQLLKGSFLLLFISVITPDLFSQEFINEDFLDNIENNAKTLWDENAADFATNTIPEKYKEESATIIGFRRAVTIDKKSRFGFLTRGERSLLFFENVRFKIKLNDKNAVQAYTAIYFRYNDKIDGFSARIIKPGGAVNPVSLNDAVGVESSADIPEFFKSFFDQQVGSQRRYYKVAVPDLEPGDILEYVTVTKSKLDVSFSGYIEFSPQYEICNKRYPVLFNQIVMDTDDKSFFKSLSLNGAPDFKKENAGESGFYRYVFTDHDRGIEKDVNFINVYRTYPLTKFQVIYANNEHTKGALIGQKGEIKSNFTKEELAKKAWEDYLLVGKSFYEYGTVDGFVKNIWTELKKLGAKDWPEKEYINKVYYKLRNIVVNRDTYLGDKTAAYIFASLLEERDIKPELIISISGSIGKLDNVLFDEEIRYISKVGDNLYFNCTDYSNPGELVESLLGSEAYIITEPARKTGLQQITSFNLPDATPSENTSVFVFNSSIAKDMNTLLINRTSSYKGVNKSRQISDAMRYTPYMLNDYKNYGGEAPTEHMKEAQEEEYYKAIKALKDRFSEAKPEFVKSQLQSEYGQKVKYKNFTVKSDGRSVKENELIFTEEFELPNMVRKAGKKYLVNIAGLVGSQLQIKKDERIRQHDINVSYARAIKWEINFKIPEGYTAEGLQELNVHVDNEAGAFDCIAAENGGTVVLKISKIYKKANLPKAKWEDMLAFVDAAYNNAYKYILLKPKN